MKMINTLDNLKQEHLKGCAVRKSPHCMNYICHYNKAIEDVWKEKPVFLEDVESVIEIAYEKFKDEFSGKTDIDYENDTINLAEALDYVKEELVYLAGVKK